jgi:hypothetical protein
MQRDGIRQRSGDVCSYTGATTRQRGGPHTDLVVVRPRAFACVERGNAALAR